MSDHDTPARRRFSAGAQAEGERGTRAAPRTWEAMLNAWGALLGELCSFLPPADADQGRALIPRPVDGATRLYPAHRLAHLYLRAWRWMWSLPPCSEARKAAFTLGHAALLIDRWRAASEAWLQEPVSVGAAIDVRGILPIGHAAESLLRIAAWHIDDASGERAAIELHGAPGPTVPRHERIYERTGERIILCSASYEIPKDLALTILADHQASGLMGEQILKTPQARDELLKSFAEMAIASLPDGPWLMTSRDVGRFLDVMLDGARGRTDNLCDTKS